DGIRDFHVTGVQTCALPIYQGQRFLRCSRRGAQAVIVVSLTEPVLNLGGLGIAALLRSQCEQSMINDGASIIFHPTSAYHASHRSEERRVGKECRARRAT